MLVPYTPHCARYMSVFILLPYIFLLFLDTIDPKSRKDNSSYAYWPAWDLRAFIVKSNDDLRQEICCLQLMQLCNEIFTEFGLSK